MSLLLIYTLLGIGVSIGTVATSLDINITSTVLNMVDQIEHHLPKDLRESNPYIDRFFTNLLHFCSKYLHQEVYFDVKYILFTPTEPSEEFNLRPSQESLDNSTFDSSLQTKIITNGWEDNLSDSSVLFDMKDRMLQEGDYNVIILDWTKCNKGNYINASVTAVFVGLDVAKLVQFLTESTGNSPKSFHLIGQSLGAQLVAFAGKAIPNLGRITGLDAAGPIFQFLPEDFRITYSDAIFVDAIHTSGAIEESDGFGTFSPYGDIDFFPNGGSEQPGCRNGDEFLDPDKMSWKVSSQETKENCEHYNALYLFLESIDDSKCRFLSFQCSNYSYFKDGNCPPESSVTAEMGFNAKSIPSLPIESAFYLRTRGHPPFCISTPYVK